MRFVDSSFWIGLKVRDDEHHPKARTLWTAERAPLVTTNHVLGETWTFLRSRHGFVVARRFIDTVQQSSRVRVLRVDDETEDEAWGWLRRRNKRMSSFVDATSFAVMRWRRIWEALAFDDDFWAAGFVEVRP